MKNESVSKTEQKYIHNSYNIHLLCHLEQVFKEQDYADFLRFSIKIKSGIIFLLNIFCDYKFLLQSNTIFSFQRHPIVLSLNRISKHGLRAPPQKKSFIVLI